MEADLGKSEKNEPRQTCETVQKPCTGNVPDQNCFSQYSKVFKTEYDTKIISSEQCTTEQKCHKQFKQECNTVQVPKP